MAVAAPKGGKSAERPTRPGGELVRVRVVYSPNHAERGTVKSIPRKEAQRLAHENRVKILDGDEPDTPAPAAAAAAVSPATPAA